MSKGIFITFEDSEGSGKSTQARLLYKYLKQRGYKAVFLREPGATKISEKIRKILLDKKNNSITPITEMLLYMAARAQVVNEVIKPALKRGAIVISDRFLDSTLAYQGYGLGLSIKLIKNIGEFVTQSLRPDLTVFLDRAVTVGLICRKGRKDRIEERSLAYHRKVRNGYLKLAAAEPNRIKVIKVAPEKSVTQKRIRELVSDVI